MHLEFYSRFAELFESTGVFPFLRSCNCTD